MEEFHDLTTSVETEIPETATRVRVRCRMNTAYAQSEADVIGPGLDARFDIQVKQALPFLAFDHSSWEVLVAVRSLFERTVGRSFRVRRVTRGSAAEANRKWLNCAVLGCEIGSVGG